MSFAVVIASVAFVRLAGEGVPEQRLKAALLSKFPQFVEWPASAVSDRPTIDVCVATPDPFGHDLEELLTGEHVSDRPLALRHVTTMADVAGCHVLYLPALGSGRHPLLGAVANRPVLTVSDAPNFLDTGGMVVLRVVGGRLRFDIDAAATRHAGLRVSSQLLRLAVSVRGGVS